MENLKDEVKEIIANAIDLEIDEFGDNEHLYNELGADSVVGFEIITKIQRKYKVMIDPKDVASLMTATKLAEAVKSRMEQVV